MIVVVHGGAAVIEDHLVALKLSGVKQAVRTGYTVLTTDGRTVLDAVESAVKCMENDPIMNCGFGSSLTIEGTVEMDAIIMDGQTLKSGAVGGVSRVQHPISLARAVMDRTDHCLLIGTGAEHFAREVGIELVANKSLVHEFAQKRLNDFKTFKRTISEDKQQTDGRSHAPKNITGNTGSEDHDTVGAVAIDSYGNCAVATSTGGITAKRVGRVGDSPIIGAGGYADNSCGAVSTTGHGEAIMRTCLARHIMYEFMRENSDGKRQSLQESMDQSLQMMVRRVDGFGGAIAVGTGGQIGIGFTTAMMSWAYINSTDSKPTVHYGIRSGEHFTEEF